MAESENAACTSITMSPLHVYRSGGGLEERRAPLPLGKPVTRAGTPEAPVASTSVCIDASPVFLVAESRSGRDLWKIVRIKMLSYKTQQHLLKSSSQTGARRRVSMVFDGVTRIVRSESNRAAMRELKYGRSFDGLFRQVVDECRDFFFASLEKARTPGKHTPWFTVFMVAVYVAIFAFMASEWTVITHGAAAWRPGPRNMFNYMVPTAKHTPFSSDFLVTWGAQHLRLIVIEKQAYRWLTAPFLHASSVHCMSNTIMYVFFGTITERTYGFWVSMAIWLCAATTGCFMAGACGDPCVILVGASGAVFGYFGFFCVDTALRWHKMKRPTIRLFLILTFTGQAIYSIVADPNVSYWAHIGGCLGGMCCSTLLMNRFKTTRQKLVFGGIFGVVGVTTSAVFPAVVYTRTARYMHCT